MLYTVKEDLQLCIDLKLTPGQLMFVKMLIPDRSLEHSEGKKASYAMSMKYQHELGGLPANELSDLIARDIIIDTNDFGKQFYEYYEINPKYAHKFTLKVYPMVAQLHDEYPNFFSNNLGREFVAKSCTLNEIAEDYLRAINNDPNEHERVLEDLKWAKKHKAIVLGLKKFIASRYWKAIRELRNKHNKQSSDVTIL